MCDLTFQTLNAIAHAQQIDDTAAIRRLVAKPEITRRIIESGNRLRGRGASGLHVVPSFTMSAYRPGYYGAGVYLLGTQRSGPINRQETVYVHVVGNRAVIVEDQPGQDW